MPSCSKVKHIVARLEHTCCECRGLIAPLDVYELTTGIWDGKADRFIVCGPCEMARDWLLEETDWKENTWFEDGAAFFFEQLREHLLEQAREGNPQFKFRALRLVVQMDRRRAAAPRPEALL